MPIGGRCLKKTDVRSVAGNMLLQVLLQLRCCCINIPASPVKLWEGGALVTPPFVSFNIVTHHKLPVSHQFVSHL